MWRRIKGKLIWFEPRPYGKNNKNPTYKHDHVWQGQSTGLQKCIVCGKENISRHRKK